MKEKGKGETETETEEKGVSSGKTKRKAKTSSTAATASATAGRKRKKRSDTSTDASTDDDAKDDANDFAENVSTSEEKRKEQEQELDSSANSVVVDEDGEEEGGEVEFAKDTVEDGEDESASDDEQIAMQSARRKHYAMVCSSNMNRSMEAHKQLAKNKLHVSSYGVGSVVKLPGPKHPKQFSFGTHYQAIAESLRSEEDDGAWYRDRGLLGMVERNMNIKAYPERWQEVENVSGVFDVVVCFEQRVFELLLDDVQSRELGGMHPLHIINLDVKDTIEEAGIGARIALEVCKQCEEVDDLEDALPVIVDEISDKYGRELTHMIEYI